MFQYSVAIPISIDDVKNYRMIHLTELYWINCFAKILLSFHYDYIITFKYKCVLYSYMDWWYETYHMIHLAELYWMNCFAIILLIFQYDYIHIDNNFSSCQCWWALLNLNVRGPSYLGLTKSISWLLMPWPLSSQGHQQPWYWLCRIGRSLSYLREDFIYLCHINVEQWHKL